MENTVDQNNYESIKRKAKEFYKKLGCVWCSKLNDCIIFNRAGFQHLIRRKRIQRPKSEQKRRFLLLFHAREIIETSKTITHKRKSAGCATAEFWVFTRKIDERWITLVTRRIGGGGIHFFSIYEKKQKSTIKVDF